MSLSSRSANLNEVRTAASFSTLLLAAAILALQGLLSADSLMAFLPGLLFALPVAVGLVRLSSDRSFFDAVRYAVTIGALSLSATYLIFSVLLLVRAKPLSEDLLRGVLLIFLLGLGVGTTYTILYYSMIRLRRRINGPATAEEVAFALTLSILYQIRSGKPQALLFRSTRLRLAYAFRNLSTALQESQPRRDSVVELDPAIALRFTGAAQSIRELEDWVALPQASTVLSVRQRLHQVLASLATGQLHHLPYSAPREVVDRSRANWTRVLFNLTAGAVPALLLLAASYAGLIPQSWREAVIAVSVLSVVLGAANAFRPGVNSSLREAQELATGIGSVRP